MQSQNGAARSSTAANISPEARRQTVFTFRRLAREAMDYRKARVKPRSFETDRQRLDDLLPSIGSTPGRRALGRCDREATRLAEGRRPAGIHGQSISIPALRDFLLRRAQRPDQLEPDAARETISGKRRPCPISARRRGNKSSARRSARNARSAKRRWTWGYTPECAAASSSLCVGATSISSEGSLRSTAKRDAVTSS